ncbi:MAG: hypothetical protein O7C59_00060, partial [Rickettsia endosymbiont of Ixodes persulcatus]|nr:hypothetical protein [Rickettsia endosymbiont of Ixodes persulcatus]
TSANNYFVANKGADTVEVFVSAFMETKPKKGINVKPKTEEISSLDRSNVHLELVSGENRVDLGGGFKEPKLLSEIKASDTAFVQLLGEAGKGEGLEIDKDGASEEFSVVFQIKKKS